MRILTVALNTFRESVRDKVLYVLIFFALITILGSKALGWISMGQDVKIMKDFSLAAMSLFSVLIAIFVGANLVYKEIDKRTLYTILCRPIHRYEFILGKYCGLILLLLVSNLLMSAVSIAAILLQGGQIDWVFGYAIVLSFAQLSLITAFAILMSTVTSPILGSIITFILYIFGHATSILIDLPAQLQRTFSEKLLRLVYYIVPNLSNFNLRGEAANSVPVSPEYLLWAMAYGAIYTAFLLYLATVLFEDKDV